MAKDYARSKCFVKKNGQYEEITYAELQRRCMKDESYKRQKFLPLHGMLMEVSEEEYIQFYQQQNRQKYLQRVAATNQEISFDMLTTGDMNGEDILTDPLVDIQEQVESDKERRKENCLALHQPARLWHQILQAFPIAGGIPDPRGHRRRRHRLCPAGRRRCRAAEGPRPAL